MSDKKVTQLTEKVTAILGVDLIPVVANVATAPANFKVTVKNFLSGLLIDLPQTTFSALKITANVTANATAAVLAAAEFILQANSSMSFTSQDRVGLIVNNIIQNGNSNVTGRMWGMHVKLDTGNSNCVSANTYGLVVEHTLDANVAAARFVSPRAYLAIKEKGPGNTTLYLMDVGAQGNTVSQNVSTGNSSVVFSLASNTTISHKLKVQVNGTDYWIPLTPAF